MNNWLRQAPSFSKIKPLRFKPEWFYFMLFKRLTKRVNLLILNKICPLQKKKGGRAIKNKKKRKVENEKIYFTVINSGSSRFNVFSDRRKRNDSR